MDNSRRFIPYVAIAAAGVAGAALALGGAYAAGTLDRESTVSVREVTVESTAEPTRFQTPGKSLTIAETYRRSAPGVVQITATANQTDPFGGSESQRALGSGFVIDKAGHIVTNYHVVEGAGSIEVTFSNDASIKATRRRHRSLHRPRRAQGGRDRARAHPVASRRLGRRPGRRPGRRDRQPVRPQPDGHGRDRQRAPAPDHRAERLRDRPRHPDRRADQPRQLRAARCSTPAAR